MIVNCCAVRVKHTTRDGRLCGFQMILGSFCQYQRQVTEGLDPYLIIVFLYRTRRVLL